MADGSGGEPGGSHIRSSSVEDYLAAVECEEAHGGYDGHY